VTPEGVLTALPEVDHERRDGEAGDEARVEERADAEREPRAQVQPGAQLEPTEQRRTHGEEGGPLELELAHGVEAEPLPVVGILDGHHRREPAVTPALTW
jgi:hypothetical protein